jgi:hypothetical protein
MDPLPLYSLSWIANKPEPNKQPGITLPLKSFDTLLQPLLQAVQESCCFRIAILEGCRAAITISLPKFCLASGTGRL